MIYDRARHGQRTTSSADGDCFRASMSVLLGVPNGDHLPNVHDPMWTFKWKDFLGQFGIASCVSHRQGPIWKDHLWIASVPSKNHDGVTHAIVMYGQRVAFDPSPLRRYRRGESLLGADIVVAGTWLEVADSTRLRTFVDWQDAHGG